jgi:hypothetical protein
MKSATIWIIGTFLGNGNLACYHVTESTWNIGNGKTMESNSRGAINIWSWAPGGCSIPRPSHNMTLTLTLVINAMCNVYC